jgi:carbon-monoxide dehydrogenase medium subunit
MVERNLQYVCPNDWDEAFSYLCQSDNTAMPYLINVKPAGLTNTNTLVDLSKLDLDYIRSTSEGSVEIGLLTPLEDLIHAPELQRQPYRILAEAAYQVAPLGLRNLATLAGAIDSHSSPAEVSLALLILDAELVARNQSGAIRTMPFQSYYKGIIKEEDNEIVVGFRLPTFSEGCGTYLARVGRTPRDEAIVATVALTQVKNSRVCTLRLAIAGISPLPYFIEAEGALIGKAISTEDIQKVVSKVIETNQPYQDYRGTAGYRQAIAGVLARRALEIAGNQMIRS